MPYLVTVLIFQSCFRQEAFGLAWFEFETWRFLTRPVVCIRTAFLKTLVSDTPRPASRIVILDFVSSRSRNVPAGQIDDPCREDQCVAVIILSQAVLRSSAAILIRKRLTGSAVVQAS